MQGSLMRIMHYLTSIPPLLVFLLLIVITTDSQAQKIWVCGEAEKVNPVTGSLISSGSYKNDLNSYELAQRQKNFLQTNGGNI